MFLRSWHRDKTWEPEVQREGKEAPGCLRPAPRQRMGSPGTPHFSKHIRATRQWEAFEPSISSLSSRGFFSLLSAFRTPQRRSSPLGSRWARGWNPTWLRRRYSAPRTLGENRKNNSQTQPGAGAPKAKTQRPTGKGARSVPQPPRSGSAGAITRRPSGCCSPGPSGGAFPRARPLLLRVSGLLLTVRDWGRAAR